MAYMNQEQKAELAPAIKAILKAHGLKGTIAVRHHSTLVINIREGGVYFGTDYAQVNVYHVDKHYEGEAREVLEKLVAAANAGNWDKSDVQSDYFNVGWYVGINIGNWNKPYKFNKPRVRVPALVAA